MIQALRPNFLKLTKAEQWTIWKGLCSARGLPCHTMPFHSAARMFDELSSAGVYHAEIVSFLWIDDKHRDLIKRLTAMD